ncbi:hypothetical protein GCM10009750_36250 [Agromyces salentinus]|uniref:DUF4232 domain-containing protein n=1 Tax=Agromyces salentinus TaxID=269421 RepID=A0ABN2N366_9MICO
MLIGLFAVVVAIVLIIVRPGGAQGEPKTEPTAPATSTPETTTIPTEATAVDGDPCSPEQITVEPVTDKTVYEAGEQPQLSVTVTNTGKNVCVLNAGTAAQVFTIKSGEEQYWTSTDCLVDPVDAEVSLKPGTPVSSAAPIVWDRTRSTPETCEGAREAVPSGGASYHLTVSVDGYESADLSKQFQLY